MYKEFYKQSEEIINDGKKCTIYNSLPITKKTLIRVEGLGDYTIIDVGSIGAANMFALLESYTYGEEDMCVIDMSTLPIMWITREDGKKFYKEYDKKLFVPKKYIAIESAYNDLTTELEDADILGINDELEYWTDEEINDIKEGE